jgi:hypothetical protein
MAPEKLKVFQDELPEVDKVELIVFGFNQVAQQTMNYNEYHMKLRKTKQEYIRLLGACLYGKRKKIYKLTGNFRMLRWKIL